MLVITGRPLLSKERGLMVDQVIIRYILPLGSKTNQTALHTHRSIPKHLKWKKSIQFTVDQKKFGSWAVIKNGKNWIH